MRRLWRQPGLIRYHGVLAPAAPDRAQIVPGPVHSLRLRAADVATPPRRPGAGIVLSGRLLLGRVAHRPCQTAPPTRIRRRGLEIDQIRQFMPESSRPRCARYAGAAGVAVVDQRYPSINARSRRRCQHKAARTSEGKGRFHTCQRHPKLTIIVPYRSYPSSLFHSTRRYYRRSNAFVSIR